MTHPVSLEDAIIFVVTFMASISIDKRRFAAIIRLIPLVVLLPLIFLVSDKPWVPNPMAGVNQGAYVLGIVFLIQSILGFSFFKSNRLYSAFNFILAAFSLFLIWQTSSRAALLSCLFSLGLVWVINSCNLRSFFLKISSFALFITGVLFVKQYLSPSSTGFPGIDMQSDLGRFRILKCYVSLPFSGDNQFIYGVGFEKAKSLCLDPSGGGSFDHAHNLYVQVFANSGILAFAMLLFFISFLVNAWFQIRTVARFDHLSFLPLFGEAAFVYSLVQGIFDLSVVHWPVTIILTAFIISAPLVILTAETLSQKDRVA
jgi:O-antigen ligase